jgi:hypothetical protein
VRGYAAYGAWAGAMWWLIKDVLCVPHGQDTLFRNVLAYALLGGVLVGTIYHPVNFIYGCAAGSIMGGVVFEIERKNYPKGFELRLKSVNEEQRANLLREDEEFELSMRNVLTTKTHFYPL